MLSHYLLITAPASEPITVAEVKAPGRIDATEDNGYLADLIVGARKEAEQHTNRALLTQTWEWVADGLPPTIELGRCPLASITSIKYLDDAGVEQTLAAANYRADLESEPARITPAYGKTWPSTYGVSNAVRVRFVAGWATRAAVPESIRHKLKVLCLDRYDRRGSIEVGEAMGVGTLFFGERVWI